jgi:hypothetical protein
MSDANREDLALYDHVSRELYPTFRREFGASLDDAVAAYRRSPRRGFNRRNLAASRLKQYALYKPVLRLHRDQRAGRVVDRLLGLA